MIDRQTMVDMFAFSLRTLKRQTDGITHEESLLQLPFRGNCMNYNLGHLLLCRDELFEILGKPRYFSTDTFWRYDSGVEPILGDEPGVIRTEKLLEMFDEQSPQLANLILTTTDETYASTVQAGANVRTLAYRVLFYFFHESEHVGEIGILRQLAGKNDKVI